MRARKKGDGLKNKTENIKNRKRRPKRGVFFCPKKTENSDFKGSYGIQGFEKSLGKKQQCANAPGVS